MAWDVCAERCPITVFTKGRRQTSGFTASIGEAVLTIADLGCHGVSVTAATDTGGSRVRCVGVPWAAANKQVQSVHLSGEQRRICKILRAHPRDVRRAVEPTYPREMCAEPVTMAPDFVEPRSREIASNDDPFQ